MQVQDDDLLGNLQKWYVSMCDGEWEHDSGFSIGTIDNPGWRIALRLSDDVNYNPGLEDFKDDRSDHDWVHMNVRRGVLQVVGGPMNLKEVLKRFLDLVVPIESA